MQLYLFNGPDPDRDVALDTEVLLHEYTHGLSERLTAGGQGLHATGLPRALSEGWADFYAMALLGEAGDDPNGAYAVSAYSSYRVPGPQLFEENYYFGIRRYPYSTDMAKNPHTLRDIDYWQIQDHPMVPMSPLYDPFTRALAVVEYWCAEVWGVTLWDARANLIAKHGFAQGNDLILRLVMDGMKLCPPYPDFLDARDALLLADSAFTGGANWDELWAAFAKRGMGINATITQQIVDPEDFIYYWEANEDFNVPPAEETSWTFDLQGTFQGSASGPAISRDGTIYLGTGNGFVFGLYPNGGEKWRFPTGTPLPPFNSTAAVGHDGNILIGCANGRLYCLGPNGDEKWSYSTPSEVRSSPAIGTDGTIYFAAVNSGFYAVSPLGEIRSGWPILSYPGPYNTSPIFGPDTSAQGTVYFGYSRGLAAFSPGGVSRWIREFPDAVNPTLFYEVRAGPALSDNGVIYVGCSDQKLYAIDAANGDISWSRAVNGQIVASPVIGSGGTVYVGTDQGTVYAYSLAGMLLWSHTFGSAIRSCPVVGSVEELYVATDSGLHALLTRVENGIPVVQITTIKTFATGEIPGAPALLWKDGTFFQPSNQRLNAWRGGGFGLAGETEWPAFHRDPQRTGNGALVTLNAPLIDFDGGITFVVVRNPWPIAVALEVAVDLTAPVWQPLLNIPAKTTFWAEDTPQGIKRFYRVRVGQP